jgi:hypothetical protein
MHFMHQLAVAEETGKSERSREICVPFARAAIRFSWISNPLQGILMVGAQIGYSDSIMPMGVGVCKGPAVVAIEGIAVLTWGTSPGS